VAAVETISLRLLGEAHDVPAEELEPETSPHNGRELRRVRVSFRVAAEESEAVSDTLTNAREPEDALEGSDGSRWLVSQSSYSYQEGDPVHRHEAELREIEELSAARLELLGLVLEPTKYKEEWHDDGIVIIARVEPDAESDRALERVLSDERDDPYFEVLRVGVHDEPLRMRFGRCLWQKTERGRAHLLRLVSEEGDDEETRRGLMWFQPELSHLERKTAAAEEAIEALLGELQAAGLVTGSAVANIGARVEGAWEKRARDFDESRDLDAYF
jgi:hypothetical protein